MNARLLKLIAAICVAASLNYEANAQEVTDDSAEGIPADELALMIKAATDHFRDPNATQFRELKFKQTKGQKNIRGETIMDDRICGKVNAKNQYGGYDGYKAFTYYTVEKSFSSVAIGC